MARVTLGTGETITVGGVTEIFGTSGTQSVSIIDGSTITFRSGFNSGGDNIRLTGTASDFVMSYSGSNVTLFSAIDNITIVIPVGTTANTITFDNGDSRPLAIVGGVPTLGGQAIPNSANSAPVAVTAGAGTYTVVSDGDGTEGDVVTFTVTRTDTTSAETLQYTVQGSTNDGTVPAAVAGADFTAAGNSVSFAAGESTKTFTVALNVDNNVEGVEGYAVSLLSGATVVATTSSLILDANNVGQTFVLTPGIDALGTGSALDLVGSEGSTSTVGQDTIIGTQADFNTFDDIDGGAERDTLVVLDNGAPFTFAPNFANVTIANVEELEYTSVRGLLAGALNTTAWAGLEMANVNINGFGTQTVTLATSTSAAINQAGGGDLGVVGGGGTLSVLATTGDVNVGTTGADNAFGTVSVTGGDDVAIADNGSQELATVNLVAFGDDATLSGSAISSVNVSQLSGGSRVLTVNATAPTVALTNISVSDFDIVASNLLTVNANGNTLSGIDDITAGNSVVLNSTNGFFYFDDVTANGVNRSVTLNANTGSFSFDDIAGADVRNVVITGAGSVFVDTVNQSGDVAGTVITSTNGGGVTINDQLGNNTQFAGSGNTGSDLAQFGANTRANTFGGGDDFVVLNSPALGLGGSLDGGAGYDTLSMESNNAAAFTVSPSATSNFELLQLNSQALGLADVINLANIGFTDFPGNDTTDVDSYVGNTGPVAEVVTVSFTGVSTWTDSVTFDGETATFADNQSAIALAAEFVAGLGGSTANWTLVDNGDGTVTMTSLNPGAVADLTSADFVFTDATTPGLVGFEQGAGAPITLDNGNAPVPGTFEVRTLELTFATVAAGQTITIAEDINIFPIADPVFTFTAPADLSHVGGELATFVASAFNSTAGFNTRWVASVSGNDVVFTATTVGDKDGGIFTTGNFTLGGNGLGGADTYFLDNETSPGTDAVAGDEENVTFTLDGVATGNDQVVFDGVTITFQDGDGPSALADAFAAQYNAAPVRNWVVTSTPGGTVVMESVDDVNVTPNLSSGDFTFIDDTNVGVPAVGVAVTTQGSSSSVTLNNFTSGSTLSLFAPLGTHIVNVQNNTVADVLNLDLEAQGADHGSVTAAQFETVNINTMNFPIGGQDTLDLVGSSLKNLVISGGDGLTLDTTSTVISSIDATGLAGGPLVWAADANTVAITVSTGSGGSDVDFSAMVIQGLAPITFLGGSGDDEVTLGGLGTSRATITTGAGNDVVNVDIVDGGNDYSSITDFDVTFDQLDFGGGAIAGLDQELEPTAIFQDYLDQAADGAGGGEIHWFYWDGDTYVVQDNAAGEDFQDGFDTVIRLEGELDLTTANFV